MTQAGIAEKWKGVCLEQVDKIKENMINGSLGWVWLGLVVFQRYFVQVDLDHLLLDGGWKRGEFEWLK